MGLEPIPIHRREELPISDAFCRDTRNIGLEAKKRAQQMGVDLGSDFEAKLDRLRTDPGKVFDNAE